MKVVLLMGLSTGGIGTHVADLAAGLRVAGDTVVVVTDPLTARRFDLGDTRQWWPRARLDSLPDLRRLRALARAADVLHAHGHQAGLLAVLVTRGLRRRPRVVVSLHNEVPGGRLGPVRAAVASCVARRSDLVTGASSDLVARARADGAARAVLAAVPSPRVPALLAEEPPQGAARATLRADLLASLGDALARSPEPDGALLVTVSRIAPQKDLGVLVDAAASLGHAATWVVIGDGDADLLDRLRGRARRTGRVQVCFAGSRSDVDRWLRAADVFVLTSRWEARALVVQEAMAAGTPVVATDTGGLHDLVAGTGLLVPVGDPPAVAAAVDRLLAEPGLARDLAGRARATAATWPDGEESARRWRAWYGAAGA